jgi:O-antigen/teichoic acid export membrane protein
VLARVRAPQLASGSLVPHAFITTGGLLAIQTLGLISGVILARALGPSDRGILAAAVLWPSIVVSLISFSLHEAIAYRVSRGRAADGQTVGVAVALAVIVAALTTLACLVIEPRVFAKFGREADTVWRWYLLAVPFMSAWQILIAIIVGQLRSSAFMTVRLMHPIMVLVVLAGVIAAPVRSLQLFALPYVIANVLALVLVVAMLVGHISPPAIPKGSVLAETLRYAAKCHLVNILSFSTDNAASTALSLVGSSASLGLFTIASSVTAPLGVVATTASLVVLPGMARKRVDERRAAAEQAIRLAVLAVSVTAIALIPVVPFAIPYFFGHAFAPAVPFAMLMVVAAAVLAVARVMETLLKSVGLPLRGMWAELSAVLVVAGTLWLASGYGALASAALAVSLGAVAALIVASVLVSATGASIYRVCSGLPHAARHVAGTLASVVRPTGQPAVSTVEEPPR